MTSLPPPKAAVFDVDGTLIDSVDQHARAWVDALGDFGVDCTFEQLRPQIGKGADQLLPLFLPTERVEREGKQIVAHRLELFKERYLPELRPFPCVRELFEAIRSAGRRTALATSAKAEELDNYLRLIGIEDLVDAKVSSTEAERSKPHPDIFLAAVDKLHPLQAGECVAVGDTPYDAEAARKAGMRVIGMLCGGFPEDDLRSAGCEAIYRDPEDLLNRLEDSLLRTV